MEINNRESTQSANGPIDFAPQDNAPSGDKTEDKPQADQNAPKIAVRDGKARILHGSPTGAGYFTIQNDSSEEDELIGVSASFAGRAELHDHVKEGDVMKMLAVESIKIPAGESVSFQKGGKHLMFFDLNGEAVKEDKLNVVLTFKKAGEIKVELEKSE
jgi:copper(I)-binding protein